MLEMMVNMILVRVSAMVELMVKMDDGEFDTLAVMVKTVEALENDSDGDDYNNSGGDHEDDSASSGDGENNSATESESNTGRDSEKGEKVQIIVTLIHEVMTEIYAGNRDK